MSCLYNFFYITDFVFSVNLIKLLIITLSLYRNTAKDIYITLSKNMIRFHYQDFSLKNSHYNCWSCLNCEMISYLHRTHFCTLLFLMREFAREFSQWARARNPFERLWLVIAFISSTELCVIGYNVLSCINASISGSGPACECRFEFSRWWFDALNILIMNDTMWLYQI